MNFKNLLAVLLAAAAWVSMPTQAGQISAIYAFGDSLIDTGGGPMPVRPPQPPAPYVGGRFTNGPTPTEHLAASMYVPLVSYAVGGAFSGVGNVDVPTAVDCATQAPAAYCTGVLSQVSQYLTDTNGVANASGLYIVMGGSNDFLGLLGATGGQPDLLAIEATAADVIANLNTAVGMLYASGARQFLLPLLPDIGASPLVSDPDFSLVVAGINELLTQAYVQLMADLGDPDLSFLFFDTFAAQRGLMPGFANSTQPCFDQQAGTVCSNPDDYFFWDDLHQTAKVSELLGAQLLQLVPEPPALVFLALVIGALTTRRQRVSHA